MKKVLLILVLVVLATGSYFIASSPELRNMIEQDAPVIELSALPRGMSSAPEKTSVTLKDAGAGLRYAAVTLRQGDKAKAVLAQAFEGAPTEQPLEFELPGRDSGFSEGVALLEVEVQDNSLWKNSTKQSVELLVDYARPRLEVLTLQHVAAQGGAELVIVRASDGNLVQVGARIGEATAPSYPLKVLDPAFEPHPDLYAILFPIPLGFDSKATRLEVFAEDKAGNVTNSALRFRIAPKKQADVESKLSEAFIRDKVFLLVPGYEAMAQKKVNLDVSTPEELAAIFKGINEDYRRLLNEKITKLNAESAAAVLWKGVFNKPLPSATSSTFGEKRHYVLGAIDAGRSRHDGLDLASVRNDEVGAANDGTILFAGELGIYGNAVIIDHGMQLITLYGHLESTLVDAGQKVAKGDKIGRTGETGLAGGDHLHFEIRLANIPVDPREWWDSHWIEDNIQGKLEYVKERLGMITPPAEPS